MDTRKTTLIATIAVIALLAVGIGYAYTASTTNTGNTTDNTYATVQLLKANDQPAYSAGTTHHVTYNTQTYFDTEVKYRYGIAADAPLTDVAKIVLTAVNKDGTSGAAVDKELTNLTIKMKTDAFHATGYQAATNYTVTLTQNTKTWVGALTFEATTNYAIWTFTKSNEEAVGDQTNLVAGAGDGETYTLTLKLKEDVEPNKYPKNAPLAEIATFDIEFVGTITPTPAS